MNNDEKLLTPAANAIFNIAKDASLINETYNELKECCKLFEDEEIRKYFADKTIDKREKTELIKKKLKPIFSKEVFSFINLLIENDIINELSNIVDIYGKMLDEHNNTVRVKIVCAYSINEEAVKKIIDTIKSFSDKKIDYVIEIDDTLIGGIIVNIGDTVYDYSIKNQINMMKNRFV
ncbi:ATP synthase F1 subunit delta [Brachyspira pilosicoli]|uniref:ATP synthase F1 subunit delta n=1 Tax=Brachyspira pilosicoli TaxID=52584 RepID=UPI0030077632